MLDLLGFLSNIFSVGIINLVTIETYKRFGISRAPHPPNDWMSNLKNVAITSAIPILSNKPELLIKPVKRLIGFGTDLVVSDSSKVKYITSIPSDRLLNPVECTNIIVSLLRNPNFVLAFGSFSIILLIKLYITNTMKQKELEILIRNHQSPITQEHKNKLAIDAYINKHGNF